MRLALSLAALAVVVASWSCSSQDDGIGFAADSGAATTLVDPTADATAPADAAVDAPLCTSTECPAPYATCPTSTYRCDRNLDTDGNNCGGCGIKCPGADDTNVETVLHADWRCSSAKCQMTCKQGFADCNAAPGDGCETNLACDTNNCGGCGIKCGAGVPCIGGTCGCAAGLTQCGDAVCGALDNFICRDLTADDNNCGKCGTQCPQPSNLPPNTISGCQGSTCGHLECQPGFDNCNDTMTDGCEIDLSKDPKNCGACGFACAAGQRCAGGECLCGPGAQYCESGTGADAVPYCAFVDVDPGNCGACGHQCPIPSSSGKATCKDARCVLQCPAGSADCDGSWSTGCETSTDSDPNNCGGCGVQCDIAAGQPCIRGVCALAPCPEGPVK